MNKNYHVATLLGAGLEGLQLPIKLQLPLFTIGLCRFLYYWIPDSEIENFKEARLNLKSQYCNLVLFLQLNTTKQTTLRLFKLADFPVTQN